MIISDLKTKLDKEFGDIYNIILINGPWGIGKTFYIKDYLKNEEYIYLSLFGINRIEELKAGLYYELDNKVSKIKGAIESFSGNNLGVSIISVPIPNIKFDVDKGIKKKLNNKRITIIIDDLERKSDSINIKELLGFIESLSQHENLKIAVIMNENEIDEKDKEVYSIFKEKVIKKVYNIDSFSENSITQIVENEGKNVSNFVSSTKLKDIVSNFTKKHKIKNLRTLQKALLFCNSVLSNIDTSSLDDVDLFEVIIASLAVVIEKNDNLYLNEELKTKYSDDSFEKTTNDVYKELNYCILKHYFEQGLFNSSKLGLINPIINIFDNIDETASYQKINDYFVIKNNVIQNKKDLFFCSEDELKERINDFVDNNIKNIDKKKSLYIWFKELNSIYPWAERIKMDKKFHKKDIENTMDFYLSNISTNEYLYNIIDRTLPFSIESENMKKYYNTLNKKIVEHYYTKLLNNIKYSVPVDNYDVELLEKLFSTINLTQYVSDKQISEIIKEIKENDFFVPNLNDGITEEQWHWCHKIWEKCSYINGNDKLKKALYETSTKLLSGANTIGKYRLESLNTQYKIKNDNNK